MKSLAKKLLAAFACAVLLTVPVAASEPTEGSALTVESITGHQPADMITEKLTLPTGYEWTASPAGIVDTKTGEITRNILQDKAVTLTATKDGVETSFNLVVKSLKTNIIVRDNFAYNYSEGTDPLTQSEFPFEHTTNATSDTTNPHKIVTETDGNRYLVLDMTSTTNGAAKYAVLKNLKNFSYDKNIYISFKYKHIKTSPPTSGAHGVHLVANKTEGTTPLAAVAYNNGGSFGLKAGFYYSNGYVYSSYLGNGADAWKTALLKWDSVDKKVFVSDNGGESFSTSTNSISDNISGFIVSPTSGSADNGQFLLDDLVVYTETLPLTLESITGHQPANMITQDLTLDNTYAWTANPAGIVNTETGVVTRDKLEDKAVTLTATKDGTTKTFNLVVKSLRTNIIMSDNFAYDYADGADPMSQSDFIFTANSTATSAHTIDRETDGNAYLTLDYTRVVTNANGFKQNKLRDITAIQTEAKKDTNIYFTFKYRYLSSGTTPQNTAELVFNNSKDSSGGKAPAAIIGGKIWEKTFGLRTADTSKNDGFTYTEYKSDGTDPWKTAVVKYNFTSDDNHLYISDGGAFVQSTTEIQTSGTNLEEITFVPAALGSNCGKLLIDDFVVYTEAEYPAEITLNESTVSVTGATEDGMLVVAQYSDNGSKLVSAKVITEGFTSVQIDSVATGNTVKCFFWDKNTLQPLALSKSSS